MEIKELAGYLQQKSGIAACTLIDHIQVPGTQIILHQGKKDGVFKNYSMELHITSAGPDIDIYQQLAKAEADLQQNLRINRQNQNYYLAETVGSSKISLIKSDREDRTIKTKQNMTIISYYQIKITE